MITKPDRHALIKRLLIQAADGLSPTELHKQVGGSYRTISRDLREIGAVPVREGVARYTYHPTVNEIELGRLFVQTAEGGKTK